MNTSLSPKDLNAMTKTTLIERITEMQEKMEAAESGPLTAGQLEKEMLSLGKRWASLKELVETNQQKFEERKASAERQHELNMKELELRYTSTEVQEAKSAAQYLEDLRKNVEDAKGDLTFGLRQAEIEHNEAMARIDQEYSTKEAALMEKIDNLEQELEAKKAEIDKEIESLNQQNARKVEQIKYDHSILIRDEDLSAAQEIAGKHGMTVVDKDDFTELEKYQKKSEEAVKKEVDTAVAIATSSLKSTLETKHTMERAELAHHIKVLENDKNYASAMIDDQRKQIEILNKRLEQVPQQIAQAVAAAKADVTVNQDNKK